VRPKERNHHPPNPNPNGTASAGVQAQLWAASGESCPDGSVPIRRTTEADVLRASSVRRFGRARARHDTVAGGHEVLSLSSHPISCDGSKLVGAVRRRYAPASSVADRVLEGGRSVATKRKRPEPRSSVPPPYRTVPHRTAGNQEGHLPKKNAVALHPL
jgi:hypothetical protein